jgi:multidrug resistance efflux pump
MLIILALYLILTWLVFAKFRLVRLNWISGTIAAAIGVFILSVFVALLNSLTPNGRITVVARVIEVTPNVSGEVVAVPVEPNVPVKAGTVLFQIDPTPFRYKVTQLEAALVAAEQNAKVLKANYAQQTANVGVLDAQFAYHQKRLSDLQVALRGGAETEFRIQDVQNQFDTTANQLQAAKAAQLSGRWTPRSAGSTRRSFRRGRSWTRPDGSLIRRPFALPTMVLSPSWLWPWEIV